MTCDVANMFEKDSSLLTGPYKLFFNNPEFECSHQMIRSLPFTFVKLLVVEVDTPLPEKYLKSICANAACAENNHIRSIQLCGHLFVVPQGSKLNNFVKQLIY